MATFTIVSDESTQNLDMMYELCDFFTHDGYQCRLSHLSEIERSLITAIDYRNLKVYQEKWVERGRIADGKYTISHLGLSALNKEKIETLTRTLLHKVQCDSETLSVIIMKLLGVSTKSAVDFVLCAYQDYEVSPDSNVIQVYGENADQVTIAHALGLKVVNIYHPKHKDWLQSKLQMQEA